MCGITGYYIRSDKSPPHPGVIDRSVKILEHRGPDGTGTWINSHVGLGARRLAIQDLSPNGNQPIHSPNGRFVIVFNGEVYNFRELREGLVLKGEVFETGTDTEVLLRLYAIHGREFLSKLNGMFALAIYDNDEKTLFLARDRFGIKPLYLFSTNDGIYFSSEIKGFFPFVDSRGYNWELNTDCLEEYMLFRHVSGSETLIKNVAVFPAGGWIKIESSGCVRDGKFFELDDITMTVEQNSNLNFEDYAEIAHDALTNAIELRTISDAPIGIALSGGVDSSLIAAMAHRKIGDGLKTYSVVFKEKEEDRRQIDESHHSRHVAGILNTDHREIVLSEKSFLDNYLRCVWHNDEPLNFPNSIGKYLLCKEASKEVKVLLGGDGGDEVFAGYGIFSSNQIDRSTMSYAKIDDVKELCDLGPNGFPFREKILRDNRFTGINRTTNYLLHTYFKSHENLLDKMSMAASVEFRIPFLDHELVEQALKIPDRFKITGQAAKSILKAIGTKFFSRDHMYRPKVGFSVPINTWLQNENHIGQYLQVLEEERFLQRPFIKRKGVLDLLQRFRNEPDNFKFSRSGRVWILLNLELWIRSFIEDRMPI